MRLRRPGEPGSVAWGKRGNDVSMTRPGVREDVADVLVRYATGIDRRDWILFRTCFTEQCDVDYGDFGHWHSVEEITAWMDDAHQQWGHTLHRLSNIVVTGDEEHASARSYVDAMLFLPGGDLGVQALGYYDDDLVNTVEGWKIDRRRFTMVHFNGNNGD
jgi:hypothetical protein